ncbi:MAG: hypothetical protein VB070_09870 [Clostridiaceae bacterium]|nr:hypothetical protein [Clostridiaceae bacterium]
MSLTVNAVVEYNDDGYLIYSSNFIGAYVRGKSQSQALAKFGDEIRQYIRWAQGVELSPSEQINIQVVQEKVSDLQICDADSDVLFDCERPPLDPGEYRIQKALVLKSAVDFKVLYDSIPDKNRTGLLPRQTFYGDVPRTAEEMYVHTNQVTDYYLAEIGVTVKNQADIAESRIQAFQDVERTPDFLCNTVYDGSYHEQWSLRKVLRRFIWHDRIHARAMWRMATHIWDTAMIENPFYFQK